MLADLTCTAGSPGPTRPMPCGAYSRDLSSAYGKLPRRTKLLFDLAQIRVAAAQSSVSAVARDGQMLCHHANS